VKVSVVTGVKSQLPIPALIVGVEQSTVFAAFLNEMVPVSVACVFEVTVDVNVIADPTDGETGVIVGAETAEFALTTERLKVEVPEVPVTVAVCV
jgi:hypothetical protein